MGHSQVAAEKMKAPEKLPAGHSWSQDHRKTEGGEGQWVTWATQVYKPPTHPTSKGLVEAPPGEGKARKAEGGDTGCGARSPRKGAWISPPPCSSEQQ